MLTRHRDQIAATQDRGHCLVPVLPMGQSAMQTACVPLSEHGQLERLGRDIVDAFMRDDDQAFVYACMKARATLRPKPRSRRRRMRKHNIATQTPVGTIKASGDGRRRDRRA